MPFWKKKPQPGPPAGAEQAVLIHVSSLADDVGLDHVEGPIIAALQRSGVGEFDGNAIGPDRAVLYLYGPDADAVWGAIESAVRGVPIGPGSFAVKRYGAPGAPEVRIELDDSDRAVGRRVRIFGGYDVAEWLGSRDAVQGAVAAWIPGQNENVACVVELDQPLTAEGDVGGARVTVTGSHVVLGLRYVGQTWAPNGIVHVELCASRPEPVAWSDRERGAWVESHATYEFES